MAQARASSPGRSKQKPVFYLLAGPNGAGKTTLYRALVLAGVIPAEVEFVNADLHEAEHLQHIQDAQARSRAAQRWAETRRAELLQAGTSLVSETVFSHESKLELIAQAQAQGFFVMLLVVALEDSQQLLARVAQRVREGGHAVPPERVLARYPRTLSYLTRAVRLANAAILYDTQDVTPGTHTAVALCKKAWTQELVQPLPAWAQRVLWGRD